MLAVPWCVAFFAASHMVGRLCHRSQVWMGHVLGAVHAAYLSWSVMNMTLWQLPLYELLWQQALPVSYIHVFQTYIVLDSFTLSSSEAWSTWLHHALHLYLTQLLKWTSRGALLGMCLSLQELSSIFLNLRKVLPAAALPALNLLFLVTYVWTRIVLVGCLLMYCAVTQPTALTGSETLLGGLVLASYVLNWWWLRQILVLARKPRHRAAPSTPASRDPTVVASSGLKIAYRLHPSRLPQRRRVLFLHGLGADLTTWSSLLEQLPPDTTALCLDCRDCGQSDMHHGYTGLCAWLLAVVLGRPPYSVHDVAQDALDVADHVWGSSATMHVVGHSLGGLVACSLTQHCPDRVCSVVGIATGSRSTLGLGSACRVWRQDAPRSSSMSDVVEAKVQFYAACAGTPAWTSWHRQHQLACVMRRIHGCREYAEGCARLMLMFWCTRIPRIRPAGHIPVHVIHGSKDAIFPACPLFATQVEQVGRLGHVWTPATLPGIVQSLTRTWQRSEHHVPPDALRSRCT
jgi:pimeloyl-ACP methyl ester carboxylesterase